MKKAKPKYSKRPSAEPSIVSRLDVVMKVQRGELTMTAGAAELGLSREYFHDLYNRTIQAMLDELTPKTGGRPKVDQEQLQREEEIARLMKEKEALLRRMNIQEEALGALVDIVKDQSGVPRTRSSKTKASTTETSNDAAEDDHRSRLELAMKLHRRGLTLERACACAALSRTTYLRLRKRAQERSRLVRRRGPTSYPPPDAAKIAFAEKLVRDTRCLIGAAGLAKKAQIARRVAGAIKKRVVRDVERERQEDAARVVVTQPGVVRGIDAMHLRTLDGWRFALISGDGSIPFRTSALFVDRYTGEHVATAIDEDYTRHGAPLVARLDRHSSHLTDEVAAVFEKHQVLVLHGPPHHPGFYGQLERQNRDHRAWLDVEAFDSTDGQDQLDEMCRCWNELIPCRKLQWCTPSEAWNARPVLDVNRVDFARDVQLRAAALSSALSPRALQRGDDQRFAIQHALEMRGLLMINNEARC